MPHALLLFLRLHDDRYHGEGDWPPCPARLFQALIAAAGLNGVLPSLRDSLEWLQKQPPPIIGAPLAHRLPHQERVMLFMPNNDLDTVEGDPGRIAEIRSATKVYQPYLFDSSMPFLYAWTGIREEEKHHADAICVLARLVYQLGRAIDMAWAWGDLVDSAATEARLSDYPGQIYRPCQGDGRTTLLCPHPGSLASLDRRHEFYGRRFSYNERTVTFRRAPWPSFKRVSYESPPKRFLYELRSPEDGARFAAWSLARVVTLVSALRNSAALRLESALPNRKEEIARVLIGRRPDGTNHGPTSGRVRIIPLPSIGHHHADFAIRRVLVEMPAGCPLRADDLSWAFSRLEPLDLKAGDGCPFTLIRASDVGMLRHFGIDEQHSALTFRTLTPAVLPESARRRLIDPVRRMAEPKGGAERLKEQQKAASAVLQALRHADVRMAVEQMRVQREPFDADGERVEAFATGTRFSKYQMWHVQITFRMPVLGPLVIGDGRFLGLGLMAPAEAILTGAASS